MKKYLNFDFIGTTLFVVGLMVVGIAFVCSSFTGWWYNDAPEWLLTVARIVGFALTATLPCIWVAVFKDYREECE